MAKHILDWKELTDKQRNTLEGMASTFGIDMTQKREMYDVNLASLTDEEAHAIAIEMYMMSRSVIMEWEKSIGQAS